MDLKQTSGILRGSDCRNANNNIKLTFEGTWQEIMEESYDAIAQHDKKFRWILFCNNESPQDR